MIQRQVDVVYSNWRFSSLRHWGENATGVWRLDVWDLESSTPSGIWNSWDLRLHMVSPAEEVINTFAIESLILIFVYLGGAVLVVIGVVYYIGTRCNKSSSSYEFSLRPSDLLQCLSNMCMEEQPPTPLVAPTPSRKHPDAETAESDLVWQQHARDVPFSELYSATDIEDFVIRFGTALQQLYAPHTHTQHETSNSISNSNSCNDPLTTVAFRHTCSSIISNKCRWHLESMVHSLPLLLARFTRFVSRISTL